MEKNSTHDENFTNLGICMSLHQDNDRFILLEFSSWL